MIVQFVQQVDSLIEVDVLGPGVFPCWQWILLAT